MSKFSDFFRKAKGKEREKVFLEVAKEAVKEQLEALSNKEE